MKLKLRELIGTVLVIAMGIPYVGYLLTGEMPFVKDPRGMAAAGLVLGAAGFLVMRSGDRLDRAGKVETDLAAGAFVLGWLLEVVDRAGLVDAHDGPASHA